VVIVASASSKFSFVAVFTLELLEPLLLDDARPMGAAVGSCVRLLPKLGDGVVGVVGVATVGREVGEDPDFVYETEDVGVEAGVVEVVVEEVSESLPGVDMTNVSYVGVETTLVVVTDVDDVTRVEGGDPLDVVVVVKVEGGLPEEDVTEGGEFVVDNDGVEPVVVDAVDDVVDVVVLLTVEEEDDQETELDLVVGFLVGLEVSGSFVGLGVTGDFVGFTVGSIPSTSCSVGASVGIKSSASSSSSSSGEGVASSTSSSPD